MTVTPLNVSGGGAVVIHSDITIRKQAEGLMRNFAYYDSLTSLANRHLLEEQLNRMMAKSRRSGLLGAVLVLDLDNFKPLNDSAGHAVGDLLLQEVSKRLTMCVREVDSVARLGGDEFVVVIDELNADCEIAEKQAMIVAEKIRSRLAKPYMLKVVNKSHSSTIEHHCSTSIGVSLFSGYETNQTQIFKLADFAMYKAKEFGRNRAFFYNPDPYVDAA